MILATCAHDTAAAVAAVPAAPDGAWAFISSGTWSLIGVELSAPVLTSEAREAGFTNEAGLDGTVRFLKNRAGMWVLEECRREWEAQDGNKRQSVEIVADAVQFLGGREDGPSNGGGGFTPRSDVPVDDRDFQPAAAASRSSAPADDDIPF